MYLSGNGSLLELQRYSFRDESELQQLLYDHYEVVMNIPEIDTSGADVVIKYREFATSRGSIDVLYITKDAELYLIETKLIRNPESSRVVISQVIDYIKAITVDGYEVLLNQTRNLSKWVMDGFVADDRFYSALRRNVRTGNIKGIIIGDDIHPNLLGLLESIQSAPHLAFHINLVRVEAFRLSGGILINAFNVENTLEVERSVIRITFGEGHPFIESESPSKEGQGSKPKLAWSEYIDTVDEKYRSLIEECRRKWEAAFGNSIRMGVVGFSGGFFVGRKRYPILFVYNESVALFSENNCKRYGAPEDAYEVYKNALMAAPEIYDMLIGGKIRVSFEDISMESLETVFEATIALGRAWMDIIGNS